MSGSAGKRRVARIIIIGLGMVFWLGWVLFAVAYYTLFRHAGSLSPDLRGIVYGMLGLFGAVNVMLIAGFFLALMLGLGRKAGREGASRSASEHSERLREGG